jgi:nitrite reductase/ring-hydroxylating ferredoxin subunit
VLRTPPFPATLADERRLDRRRFLGTLGAAALLATGAGALARRLDEHAEGLTPVTAEAVAGLAPGDARVLARADGETLVARLADGELAAFDRRCPHLGCPVVWAAARGRFECPCHHAAFDARTGRVLFGPPRSGLRPVTIANG